MPRKGAEQSPGGSGRDYGAVGGGRVAGALSYCDADLDLLSQCIEAVTQSGDALLFSRTSDGGALSVRVLSGGRTHAFYPTSFTALNELLTEIMVTARA